MDFNEYLVPLLIAKVASGPPHVVYVVDRYAGVSFFVDDNARVVTCKHIVQMCQPGEILMGFDLVKNVIKPLSDIKCHKTFDFATAIFQHKPNYKRFTLTAETFYTGVDVHAMGFTSNGKRDGDVHVDPRLFKGHIVRSGDLPVKGDARSTLEISFPSHKGFSGAPLIRTGSDHIVGMLFSNLESSIEIHSFLDVEKNGDRYKEGMFRIIELGLAHSNRDITAMLAETLA